VSLWAAVAACYAVVLVVAAVTQPIRRRAVALAAVLAYGTVAIGAGTLGSLFWVHLLVPGALLLAGYWLSGFFFRDPQPWLESWLLRVDRAAAAPEWMARMPRLAAEFLELSYVTVYAVVGGGAIYAAAFGVETLAHYWTLVLASELASYAPLPWLRSRPPRAIESLESSGHARWAFSHPEAAPYMRRLNTAILDRASVQANTLPSGHVAGAVAAALGVLAVNPVVGWSLMVMAGVIAIAAIAGRYHYVVDCVAGAAVALAFWSVM
jgi:hypothetical protein